MVPNMRVRNIYLIHKSLKILLLGYFSDFHETEEKSEEDDNVYYDQVPFTH